MASLSPRLQLIEARRLAREHGLFIVEKEAPVGLAATDYIVYRQTPRRPVRLGRRGNPDGLLRLVRSATKVQPCPR